MDILKKITQLREDHHWTEYQLAEKSGLTQSTISSWYRKNTLPSIPSLNRICEAFGMTLSQFFLEESNNVVLLNDRQFELLSIAERLDIKQYNALIQFLKEL